MTGSDAERDPIREEAMDWLLKLERAPDDEALRAELAAWRRRSEAHDQAYRSVARMWRLAGDLPPDYAAKVEARSPLETGRDTAIPQRSIRMGRRRLRPTRIASGMAIAVAACLLIFAAPSVELHLRADHMTGVGEVRSVRLDDGSIMHLAAESAAAVDFEPARRNIRLLAGQAFFDVVGDAERPFVVATEGLFVTVTGTGFAVDRSPDETSVAVESGSVSVLVDSGDMPAFRLQPGDRLSRTPPDGAAVLSKVPPGTVAAWRTGQLVVDGVRLARVIDEISRYHQGVIWLRDAALAEKRVTGVFSLRDPAAALETAAGAHNADVTAVTPYLLVIQPR